MRKTFLIFALLFSFRGVEASPWTVGVREGGGGFYLLSPDQAYQLTLMGYTQLLGQLISDHYRATTGGHPTSFSVRRLRLDVQATIQRDYELLIETGTPSIPGSSTFGVNEVRLTTPLFEDWLSLRVGKFVGPFSTEDGNSSRALSSVERHTTLNTLYGLPALSSQLGGMVFGRIPSGRLSYFLAFFNGNTGGTTITGDNNGDKEIQLKFMFQPVEMLRLGLGFDTSYEEPQTLTIVDHLFQPFATKNVSGRRFGYSFDLEWFKGPLSLRYELNLFRFKNDHSQTITNAVTGLLGGYFEAAYFFNGSEVNGLQGILRFESTRYLDLPATSIEPSRLNSLVVGLNWFLNSNIRNQVNLISEFPDRVSTIRPYDTQSVKHMIFNELQVKF